MATIRIHPEGPAIEPSLIARYGALSTSLVSDSMDRSGALQGIGMIGRGAGQTVSTVGPALTVRVPEGDNLALHVALDLLEPGMVLAVDAGGFEHRAVTGELMIAYAEERGAVAIVVDGAVRDVEQLRAGRAAVFAKAVTHLGPYKSAPGEIRGPIALGGVSVRSGDLIMGDADGLVVVPHERLAEIADAGEATARMEEELLRGIRQGNYDRPWLTEVAELRYVSQR